VDFFKMISGNQILIVVFPPDVIDD